MHQNPKSPSKSFLYDEYSGAAQILMDRDRNGIPPDEKYLVCLEGKLRQPECRPGQWARKGSPGLYRTDDVPPPLARFSTTPLLPFIPNCHHVPISCRQFLPRREQLEDTGEACAMGGTEFELYFL